MKTIIENNLEIVNSIREIYRSDFIMVRKMIEKHFIPSNEEKKNNAEIPTPVVLVEEMLDKVPVDYWSSTTNKTFEPCCGKGNFVLGVVDRMLKGLEHIEDKKDRCIIVMRNLYYADITTLNVFITTELLKCHLEKYCNGEVLEFSFNKYIGNTLELDIKTYWNIEGFNLVVGNPPYSKRKGECNLYISFIQTTFDNLVRNGYLLFVTPRTSINYLIGTETFRQKINKLYNILYINSSNNIKNKYFKKVGSDFVYFLVQNSEYNDITSVLFENNSLGYITLEFNKILDLSDNNFIDKNILLNKLIKNNLNEWNRKAARIETNLSDIQTIDRPNKIIYKIKTKVIDYKYTDKTHKDFNIYKVLYPTLGNNYIIDKDRNLFPGTSFVVYIPCIDLLECNNIIKLKDSLLFKYLINIFKSHKSPTDYIWRNLAKNGYFNINIINDNDIYKYFNLTPEEVNIIESK